MCQKIVVKVGTSSITRPGGVNLQRLDGLTRVLSDLRSAGHQLVLVSSGAIAVGCHKLRIPRPSDVRLQQAAAAVGQCELMHLYDKFFGEYGQTVAQVLLTEEDVADETRSANLAATIGALLELGAIPIVNENDSVSHAEIQAEHTRAFGDNDTLSAIVAELFDADLLVLLTDIDGLYDKNPSEPDAALISHVTEITPELRAAAGGGGAWGTGGMQTKLDAAERCLARNIDMLICKSEHPAVLYAAADGNPTGGTMFSKQK